MCTNIRSLIANFDEIILFLENDTHSKNNNILILTEIWHINADNFGSCNLVTVLTYPQLNEIKTMVLLFLSKIVLLLSCMSMSLKNVIL